jgi:hypothetical protein
MTEEEEERSGYPRSKDIKEIIGEFPSPNSLRVLEIVLIKELIENLHVSLVEFVNGGKGYKNKHT